MRKVLKGVAFVVLALLAGFALTAVQGPHQRALGGADDARASGGPHYSVIETQGFNLLVADNASNTLYYYATDKDTPIGSPLKLRASLDLSQVGKPEIKITPHNLENIRTKEKVKEPSRD
jgi:hypothetical protein